MQVDTPPLLYVNRNRVRANGIAYSLAPGTTARIEGLLLTMENAFTGERLSVPAPFDAEWVLILASLREGASDVLGDEL